MYLKTLLYIGTISTLLFLVSCKTVDEVEEETLALPVLELTERDTVLEMNYVADINAINNVEIRNRVLGYIEKIFVDEGKKVEKDQALFLLNSDEYKAELASATANMQSAIAEQKSAELEVDRVKILVDKEVVSKTEFDMAKAKLNAAIAKVDEAKALQTRAQLHLNSTKINAPFAGLLDRIPLKTGSLVQEGSLLTTISDISSVYVYFAVSETQYLKFKKDIAQNNVYAEDVHLMLADGSSYPHKGQIETIEGQFDKNTGSISFRAKFPNPDLLLKHGSTGRLILPSKLENVVIVPQKAVLEIQDQLYVYVLQNDGSVQLRSFKSMAKLDRLYIVEKGLKKGEKVVCEGLQNIDAKTTKVKPTMVTLNSLLK